MNISSPIFYREYRPFLHTLRSYQEAGVILTVEGRKTNARRIAELCIVRERGAYMSDYIRDADGRLVELRFDRVVPPQEPDPPSP